MSSDHRRDQSWFKTEDDLWISRILHDKTPLVLKSLDSNNSLLISSFLSPAQQHSFCLPVNTLIDCGCSTYGFADSKLCTSNAISTIPLSRPRSVLLGDGETTQPVNSYFIAKLTMGYHTELCLLYVTDLSEDNPIILGVPWLRHHDPTILWSEMKMSFTSRHCHQNCLPAKLPIEFAVAPTATTAISRTPAIRSTTSESQKSNYRPPSVEDYFEIGRHQQTSATATDLELHPTLTPGADHYRTHNPRSGVGPETRARMIPNQPKLRSMPTSFAAGSRCVMPPPAKPSLPPLSAPVPAEATHQAPVANNSRDKLDIRYSTASSFLQFCRGEEGTEVLRVTWDELDKAVANESKIESNYSRPPDLPDLDESVFRDILVGKGDPASTAQLFPRRYHDYILDCFQPMHLNRISEADINKFLEVKQEMTTPELLSKLPSWLHDQSDAFQPKLANELPPQRAWDHKIELMPGCNPPYQKNRPLSTRELAVVRRWLDDNLNKGFIRESRSRSAAPLMLAVKPGGGVRVCQDYRGLNNITIKNRYPLPLIRETLDALCHAKIYTKLDIIAAFNKLRIAEGHEWKTAFITRFGLFESLVMPFGLCNAPASFQHYINHQLFDLLDKTCTAYLDDILIFSQNKTEHRQHVREVVQRLQDAGLQIDIKKCEFETVRTKYLGLIITPEGIEMDTEKVAAITSWQTPTSVKELQRFLGFANFYRRFIKGFSQVCAPLNELLRKDVPFEFKRKQTLAFQQLKDAFTQAPILAYFDYNKRAILETDASNWASGGVLSQMDDSGMIHPVAFFSTKHSPAECNYEIYDKELLAIIKALEEWRPELQGTAEPFEIITDHKNLAYFTSTKALNQRQVRWSEFLSQFNFQIVYRPGALAVLPDALSRKAEDRPRNEKDERLKHRKRTVLPETVFDNIAMEDLINQANKEANNNMCAAPIDMILPGIGRPIDELIDEAYTRSEIASDMILSLQDRKCRNWPHHIRKYLGIQMSDCKVVSNRIYFRDRLFLPPDDELRTQVLYRTHSSGPGGHPGRTKTLDLLTRTYWWPNMSKDAAEYVRACNLCMRVKPSRSSPQGYLQPLPIPYRAWSDISVDYITPLPECLRNGVKYKHLLVVVCRLTKMRHFMAVPSLNVDDLVTAFVGRVYSLHGTPDNIVSDRGTQFVSEFWIQLSSRLGIAMKPSSAFHPETDGQTERLNTEIEVYLRAFMSFHQDDWVDWLGMAEFAANNAKSETTGASPFFANYGFNPRLGVEPADPPAPNITMARKQQFYRANAVASRFERILEQLTALARASQQRYETNANNHRTMSPRYQVGDLVYVNTKNMKTNRPMKKGDDKWDGPYEVTEVYPRACRLKLPDSFRIYPVFHNALLRHQAAGPGLKGQAEINAAETRHVRGRILERDDGMTEPVEKWEFIDLLDVHNQDGHHYLVKWKHQKPSWQPAADLKGQNDAVARFHRANPHKCPPPAWVKMSTTTSPQARRGPGRPRKERENEPPQEKRGRGRPRKVQLSMLGCNRSLLLRCLGLKRNVSFASIKHVYYYQKGERMEDLTAI